MAPWRHPHLERSRGFAARSVPESFGDFCGVALLCGSALGAEHAHYSCGACGCATVAVTENLESIGFRTSQHFTLNLARVTCRSLSVRRFIFGKKDSLTAQSSLFT